MGRLVKTGILYTGKLIAVRTDGQPRYEYSGQCDKKLSLSNVCTDQVGHVLITDVDNSRVHILDQEGQFIQYILTSQQGLSKPITIDVDMEGYIWVGEYVDFYKGRVKVAGTEKTYHYRRRPGGTVYTVYPDLTTGTEQAYHYRRGHGGLHLGGEYVDFYKGRAKVAKYLQLIGSDVKCRVSHELNPVDLHLHVF